VLFGVEEKIEKKTGNPWANRPQLACGSKCSIKSLCHFHAATQSPKDGAHGNKKNECKSLRFARSELKRKMSKKGACGTGSKFS
jgi:hypothetical protein